MSSLSDRDRRTIEKAERKYSDIKIVKGLLGKGHSIAKISELMGASESEINILIRKFPKPYNETPTDWIIMPKTKTEIAKTVVGFVVGFGASRIAKAIIDKNTDEEERLHNRAAVASAQLTVGFMASDATRRYTDAKIDEIVDWWETNVKPRL